MRQRHANQGGSQTKVRRAMCELWWTELTTCDVSVSLEAFICQIHAKEMIGPLDDGSKTSVRCDGKIRQLNVEMK